ncbi:MAG: ParB/RepB/Spo0J family partition protein [Bacteroidota bacterium]
MKDNIKHLLTPILAEIEAAETVSEKIQLLNDIREALHQVSPQKHHPIDFVRWAPSDPVTANDYNPNAVAPPEMELLHLSIAEDGFTQPIVANEEKVTKTLLKELGVKETLHQVLYVIIDGFHRNRVGKEKADIKESLHGYLPIVQIRKENRTRGKRMASTVRHNRARGKHGIKSMVEMVGEFVQMGWQDKQIGKHLGMAKEEVIRFKQSTGLLMAFMKREFSKTWTEFIEKHNSKFQK